MSLQVNKYDRCRPWIIDAVQQNIDTTSHIPNTANSANHCNAESLTNSAAQIIGIRWISPSKRHPNGDPICYTLHPQHPVHYRKGICKKTRRERDDRHIAGDAQIVGFIVADGIHSIDCHLRSTVPYHGPFALDDMVQFKEFKVETDAVSKRTYLLISDCSIYSVLPELPAVYGAYSKDINEEYGIWEMVRERLHDQRRCGEQQSSQSTMLIDRPSNNMDSHGNGGRRVQRVGPVHDQSLQIKQEMGTAIPPQIPKLEANAFSDQIPTRNDRKRKFHEFEPVNEDQVKKEVMFNGLRQPQIKRQRNEEYSSKSTSMSKGDLSVLETTVPPDTMQYQMVFMWLNKIRTQKCNTNRIPSV